MRTQSHDELEIKSRVGAVGRQVLQMPVCQKFKKQPVDRKIEAVLPALAVKVSHKIIL